MLFTADDSAGTSSHIPRGTCPLSSHLPAFVQTITTALSLPTHLTHFAPVFSNLPSLLASHFTHTYANVPSTVTLSLGRKIPSLNYHHFCNPRLNPVLVPNRQNAAHREGGSPGAPGQGAVEEQPGLERGDPAQSGCPVPAPELPGCGFSPGQRDPWSSARN